MVTWVGYGGEQDPVEAGASRERELAARLEKSPRFKCPDPQYKSDEAVRKVAVYMNTTWLDARSLFYHTPGLFNRLLGWSEVNSEGEVLANEWGAAKSKIGVGDKPVPKPLGEKLQ